MWKRGLTQIIIMPLPWFLRRRLLRLLFRYDIDATARIGLSIVIPNEDLIMGPGSYIGHLTLARGMHQIIMGPGARIGNLNWIYAIPLEDPCLAHEPGRRTQLVMDDQATIVHRHTVDCSNAVHLGRGALVAGNRTQIVTHGLSTRKAYQLHTAPITIGNYSMVGTGCILLSGAGLPDYSVLGAGSTLRDRFGETHAVYSGVPAGRAAGIPSDSPFFLRAGLSDAQII